MLLDMIAALIASVVNGIVTHYAIKWLDPSDDDKKQAMSLAKLLNQQKPRMRLQLFGVLVRAIEHDSLPILYNISCLKTTKSIKFINFT